jgi:hypothetical protein
MGMTTLGSSPAVQRPVFWRNSITIERDTQARNYLAGNQCDTVTSNYAITLDVTHNEGYPGI